jgi:hypothetical protein
MGDPVGTWTSTDQRLDEMHDRLVTWWFGSAPEGADLQGVWMDAFRRFDARLRQTLADHPTEEERLMATPAQMILECFEASLDDHDHILATFPQSLPDGWIEWPASPEE